MAEPRNRWVEDAHALDYLDRLDGWDHHHEGDRTLVAFLPERCERVLDLGAGDGRLTEVVLTARPGAHVVAVDLNAAMLVAARRRFAGRPVDVVEADLDDPLPPEVTDGGPFDAVVSSFAIHHLTDARKAGLFAEVFELLRPGGAFLDLEHVASVCQAHHLQFLACMEVDPGDDDPSNILAPVEDQLGWLRDVGFAEVDCHWKWRELALFGGVRPEGSHR